MIHIHIMNLRKPTTLINIPFQREPLAPSMANSDTKYSVRLNKESFIDFMSTGWAILEA